MTKDLLAATAVAAIVGATVIVTATTAQADNQPWGAIAYSPLDGASGSSSQHPTESNAKEAAILDCGNNGGSGCQVVVTVQKPNCASLVANESLYSFGVAQAPDDAKESALADLNEPGSEVTSTCGFAAGTPPGAISSAPTPTAPSRPHQKPAPPSPAPIAPAPTLR